MRARVAASVQDGGNSSDVSGWGWWRQLVVDDDDKEGDASDRHDDRDGPVPLAGRLLPAAPAGSQHCHPAHRYASYMIPTSRWRLSTPKRTLNPLSLLLLLTVCHDSNFASSKLCKQNKYRLLGDDKTSFTGTRAVLSHTMEVSTLGLASDTKDFTSATKLPDVPNSL